MKIAIIGPSTTFLSGVSYYTIRLSNALSEYLEVCSILFRNMLPRRLFPGWRRVGKVEVGIGFNERVKFYEIMDWNNPITWLKAFNLIRDCDVVILQWWTSSVAHMYLTLEILNRVSSKIPIVIEFHEVVDPLESSIVPVRIYSKVVGRVIRGLANHHVVHSKEDRELIGKIYKIPLDRIHVIPHGIYDHYRRMDRSKAREILNINDFTILFFGLLRPYKGVKYLVKAFEMLPKDVIKDSRLLIVGETWEDRESIEIIKRSKFSKRITLINKYVPDDEVSLYFSASDVLVVPYTRASQSGVAHIAMSFGIPIVASYVGGLKDSLSRYKGTVFVNPGDVYSLRDAILELYFKSRRRYKHPKELKWENVAKRWIDILEQIKSQPTIP